MTIQFSRIEACHAHRIRCVKMSSPGLCRVHHGTKRVVVGKEEVAITAGQWLLLPPHIPLEIENIPGPQGYSASVLGFPQSLLSDFRRAFAQHLPALVPATCLTHWRVPPDPQRDAAWERLSCSLAASDAPVLQHHRLNEVLLMLGLAGLLSPLLNLADAGLSERIKQLILSDLAGEWSQARVAAHCCMSAPTLRRHLAAEGHTFRVILEDARMAQALHYVQSTQRSIEAIAQACGYASPSRFAVRFRTRFGLSPRSLRKAMQR